MNGNARCSLPSDFVVDSDEVNLRRYCEPGYSHDLEFKILQWLSGGGVCCDPANFHSNERSRFSQLYDRVLGVALDLGIEHAMSFVLRIACLTFLTVSVNHLGCCIWYTVFIRTTEIHDEDESTTSGFVPVWVTGMYWSMSTMLAGSSPVKLAIQAEFVYSMVYVLFAAIFGGFLISCLMQMMMQLLLRKEEHAKNLKMMENFLEQHHITSDPGNLPT